MLKINKKTISLTRGDNASIRLRPRYDDEERTEYVAQEGDRVIFRMKVKNQLIEKECNISVENNRIVVSFIPQDTIDLDPGVYRYEAELITSWAMHYTFLQDQTFILTKELERRLGSEIGSSNSGNENSTSEIDGELNDDNIIDGDLQPTNPSLDYDVLENKPKLNGKTIQGSKNNEDYGIPTKLSEMDNDDNYVQDEDYQHTDNNFSDEYKGVIDNLGTASGYDVPVSGNAGNDEVVLGNDTRLSDARPASDVSSWAKAPNKPTYSASEVGAIPSTEKGSANGVAELDANGKVPSAQLPAYVDDVLEYASVSAFPETGESGKIYIALDTNKTYRWGGSAYTEISESLALGETSSTAYRGDKGKTAYDHATETKLSTATASGLYKVASTAQGHIAGLTPVEKTDITALGIPAQDTTYNDATTSASGLMSANDKTKLNGIASGAQVNVQSDFAQTDTEADDFIKNKPTKVSDFTNDSGFTKVESSTTNGNIKINGTETQVYNDSELQGIVSTDETTVEGNPLNFSTKSAQNAESTLIDLEPIQDLHGYDKPWVGGAGKNKLPLTLSDIKSFNTSGTWTGNVYAINGINITVNTDSDGNVTKISTSAGTPSATIAFVLYYDTSNFLPENSNFILNGCPAGGSGSTFKLDLVDTISGVAFAADYGGGSTFATPTVTNNINCRIVLYATSQTAKDFYPMIRLSTESDATFAPYENKASISGRSEIGILGTNGKESTDPDYEVSNDLTISLGQTAYGAQIDLEKGECVVDKGIIVVDGTNISFDAKGGNSNVDQYYLENVPGAYLFGLSSSWVPVELGNQYQCISNQGDYVLGSSANAGYSIYISNNNKFQPRLSFPLSMGIDTLAKANTYAQSNPIQFIYPLATPTTITLTPNAINLLKGSNYITTDGDKITLTYRTGEVATLGDLKEQIAESQILTDTATGTKYKLVVTNGVLDIEEIV